MKKTVLLGFIASMLIIACTKDKFKTNPQISVSSYNTKVVNSSQDIVIQLKYTDKEGDLGNGQLMYLPVRTNRRQLPDSLKATPTTITLPKFPNNSTGFIQLDLPWSSPGLHQDYIKENDTIYFRFVAIDVAGHKSDTVNSDPIVFLQQ